MMNTLDIKAKIQVQKPVETVFEAIVDPRHMSGYFIAGGSGRIEEGKELNWTFPEFDINVPVLGARTESPSFVSFYWDAENGKKCLVTMTLEAKGPNDTLVTVTEGSMENNEAGLKWLKGNTEGWANFLACLKAYLEYGINLRKGAFDFMRK
ncbi:MAG: SRPBCC domain-containing protein [Chitinophagaceae bacterium]|nr:SRPBCC domain-containing protein [Chitinophagaceae bacterium]